MIGLPNLGVGLVCLPGFESIVESIGSSCDVIEVEPQPFWINADSGETAAGREFRLNEAGLDRIQDIGCPLLVHSVGYPVGGSAPGDPRQKTALRETLARLAPAWWSEHVNFLATGHGSEHRYLGFLMPPVQSDESIALIVDRIKSLQDAFGLPFAFETGVNYLRPLQAEIPDGAFWGEIADRADCGILLDLHNVWTNERNGRQSVARVVGDLPLDRVWEIHLAGGKEHKGYWLDAHSGLPPAELLALAGQLVPCLPALRAIILEIIPDYLMVADLTAKDLARCLAAMRVIWESRATAAGGARSPGEARDRESIEAVNLPSPSDWEERLRRAVDPGCPASPEAFSGDPAIEIYRDLIGMIRRGTIAESLPLTTRYLLLASGEAAFEELLQAFWCTRSPEPFMSDEARNFADYLATQEILPHLDEVLAFEIAAHRAAMTGKVQRVRFTSEPEHLLRSLNEGTLPDRLCPAEIEVEVLPPAER